MYPQALSEILVFRTNISHASDEAKLASVLNSIPGIRRWNLDRQDVDHVLRVDSNDISAPEIIYLLKKAGFACEELPD
jgi:hypothetical protein